MRGLLEYRAALADATFLLHLLSNKLPQQMKNTFISGMSLLVFKSSYLSCKSHARAPAVSKIRRRVVESSHGSRASC